MTTHRATFGDQTAWMMIWEPTPGNQIIKVNSKNEINEGDVIYPGENKDGIKVNWKVKKVIESRPSTLSGLTYFTLDAERILVGQE